MPMRTEMQDSHRDLSRDALPKKGQNGANRQPIAPAVQRVRKMGFLLLLVGLGIAFVQSVGVWTGPAPLSGSNTSLAQQPDWWTVQKHANQLLFQNKCNLFELAKDLRGSPPKTAQEAMFTLTIMMRAGLHVEAIKTLKTLRRLCGNLGNDRISCIYRVAYDRYLAWGVARRALEIFADNVSCINLRDGLLEHFEESGWNRRAIDNWFAKMPEGKDRFWIKERLLFNGKNATADRLLDQLAQAVKKRPEDIPGAISFLDVLLYIEHVRGSDLDLSWLTRVCHPDGAVQARELAERLKMLAQWAPAATFYRLALAKPLTDQEVRHLKTTTAIVPPEATVRARFVVAAKEGLAECLLELDQKAEAQKLTEEAVALREKHGLRGAMWFAGAVQQATGARVIEERIPGRERKSMDDPEYWLERATYYRGRGEVSSEEEAYRKGLALSASRLGSERALKADTDRRAAILWWYARFLREQERHAEAAVLLRRELSQSPLKSSSVRAAASIMAQHHARDIDPDDNIYWQWLASRRRWHRPEQDLLGELLKNVERESLDPYFLRAEKLAEGADPSRSETLGCVLNTMGFPTRAMPLLEYAVEHTTSEALRERAALCLFQSYLDADDWRSAESIFPEAAKRPTTEKLLRCYGRIALVAARSGAKQDAIRVWKIAANVDLAALGNLEPLASAGLRRELVEYYESIRTRLPGSVVPGRALHLLGKE